MEGWRMRILIVEDDGALADGLKYHLERDGYAVDVAPDGEDGWRMVKQGTYELMLLDRMLPGLDGVSLMKRMRIERLAVPVLMITALGGLNERVEGLDAGADDYLVKPFHTEELLARVRALARRPAGISDAGRIVCGDLTLDAERGLLTAATSCPLTRREASLMVQFMKNPGRTLPRELLLGRVWGPDAPVEDGNLDNYIYFLRKRLKAAGSGSKIQTVHALGYRLEAK
jgi:DNA-binding response OmpR family regulator